MNLQPLIQQGLWGAVSSTYGAENFSHAILDAIHYLTDVLRDKSGLDSDGVRLVGDALGGSAPKVRVNRLQTQTERDVQDGLQQMLRGLYLGIRTPEVTSK